MIAGRKMALYLVPMDWTLLIGYAVVTALLLLLSFIDQHYSGIIARKDREIQILNDELVPLRAIAEAIDDEEFEREMAEMRDNRPDPYTIHCPLDDAPWPKKDGTE